MQNTIRHGPSIPHESQYQIGQSGKEELIRRAINEIFAWKKVHPEFDAMESIAGSQGEVSTLGKETANESILVFIGAAFKGRVRMGDTVV